MGGGYQEPDNDKRAESAQADYFLPTAIPPMQTIANPGRKLQLRERSTIRF